MFKIICPVCKIKLTLFRELNSNVVKRSYYRCSKCKRLYCISTFPDNSQKFKELLNNNY